MKFEKGLYRDSAERDQPEGSYRYAKNIIDGNVQGAKENEPGFTSILSVPSLGGDTKIIGVIPTGLSFVVFSTDDTHSAIGVVQNDIYTEIYNNDGLNFKKVNPIIGTYRINVNGERVVVWLEDNNPPRILNIDNLSLINDVSDLNIFQDVNNPSLTATLSDNGGNLVTSAIIPITKYKSNDGAVTAWFVHDKVIYINDDSRAVAFQDCDGAPAGTGSNKSINLVFNNCDTRFDTLTVGYIQSINGILTVYEVEDRPLSANTSATITGGESKTEITLDEVLTANASYNNAKAITQVKGQLVLGNLTADDIPDYQKYALGIKLNYTKVGFDIISNIGTHKDRTPLTFMPGEVYAMYIGLELNSGGWAFYHIPGRPSVSGETNNSSAASAVGLTAKKYQVENTAGASTYTNMGYWENSAETYPVHSSFDGTSVGNADLRGLPVRHHRFPDLNYLMNTFYHSDINMGVTRLVRLGISASNVIIPPSIQSKIKRWKIFFAKKDKSNSLVLGSDLMQFAAQRASDTSVRWGTGGNWTLVAVQAGTDSWEDLNAIKTDTIRGHSLDLYKDPSLTPTLTWVPYKLRRTGLNTQWSGFRSFGGRLTTTGSGRGEVSGMVVDYTVPFSTVRTDFPQVLSRLSNFKFVPNMVIDGAVSTNCTEGVFSANITADPQYSSIAVGKFFTNSKNKNPGAGQVMDNGLEDTFYMILGQALSNVHVSFTGQDLVPTEQYGDPTTTTLNNIDGGDTFMCYMSYLACGPLHAGVTLGDANLALEGIRAWKGYVGYSKNNWNFRHEITGTIGSKYMGKTDVRTLFTPTVTVGEAEYESLVSTLEIQNVVGYNPDYSLLNTFFSPVIFNPTTVRQTAFPNLLIWSPVQGEESADVSWRTFPVGNRYTMPKNKGVIVNIQGINNRDLLVHHEFSLYKTRTDAGMSTDDAGSIFLKSNDFFSIPPEELMSTTNGYAGTQNKFACKLTKAGYAFVDDIQGKVFLYNGESLEEISAMGMRQLFRDNMKIRSDNPFTSSGYNVEYDERFNRIIFSKKQTSQNWTISFNPTRKGWTSFHDYTPDCMFTLVDTTLYSFSGLTLYKHNVGNRGAFYDGTTYSSFIDIVHNPEPTMDKIFNGTKWITELYDSSGTPVYDQTLTHLSFYDLDHSTDRVALVSLTSPDLLYEANIRILREHWYFNAIRDVSIAQGNRLGLYSDFNVDPSKLLTTQAWYDQRYFTGKWVICRYEFVNNSNKRILLVDTEIDYEHAT